MTTQIHIEGGGGGGGGGAQDWEALSLPPPPPCYHLFSPCIIQRPDACCINLKTVLAAVQGLGAARTPYIPRENTGKDPHR